MPSGLCLHQLLIFIDSSSTSVWFLSRSPLQIVQDTCNCLARTSFSGTPFSAPYNQFVAKFHVKKQLSIKRHDFRHFESMQTTASPKRTDWFGSQSICSSVLRQSVRIQFIASLSRYLSLKAIYTALTCMSLKKRH